jgi:hypothetical protein
MDIVKQLHGAHWTDASERLRLMTLAIDEIVRLREDKAELVEALINMRNHINERDWDEDVSNEAKATFAKSTGGK